MSPHLFVGTATTPERRARGLMFRRYLPPDHGMLFVFPTPQVVPFWNMNTLIPLDVGFYDRAGRLIDVFPLRALRETSGQVESTPRPNAPYRFVLETNRGWFAAHGLKRGDPLPRITVLGS